MKKVIFTITLLFSHVSFGLDALDGKSILCERTKGPGYAVVGFKFVGHNVIGDGLREENDKVTIIQTGMTPYDGEPVDSITPDYIRFWYGNNSVGYTLNRETLELNFHTSNGVQSTYGCSVYTSTEDYLTNLENIRRQRQEAYNKKLEKINFKHPTRHE